MEHLSELSISGIGKVNGGTFNHVDISGVGKVFGDIEAERISISGKGTIEGNAKVTRKIDVSGMATITGNLTGGEINLSGKGAIEGDIECQVVECSGNLKIHGYARVAELDSNGRTRVDKDFRGEKVRSHGYISVGGDLEAEEFYNKGSFTVEGLLNANQIEIEIHGFCKAKEIGGEEIRVRNHPYPSLTFVSKLVNSILGNGRELDKLTADLIEGTNVTLEHTHAKVVRGNNVKIGRKCVIDEVEYTHSIEVDPDAVVKVQNKIE